MEGPIKEEDSFEVLKTPEIVIQDEEGSQLLSLILKAKNPEWGGGDNPLAEETREYFEANQLDKETLDFLDEIRALQNGGVDKEALYNIALTYGHQERNDQMFEFLAEHKSYIKNPQELQQKLFKAIDSMKRAFSASSLSDKFNSEAEQDKKARLEKLEETRARIEKLIDFFKPDSDTTKIKRVSLTPTDPLVRKNTGTAFVFGEELVLKTHIDNPDNLEHEFSHSVINPIVSKLFDRLTHEQKGKISELANKKLKQDYGEGCYSLLCEEFIRTYNDVFKIGRKPQTYEDFKRKIDGIVEEIFQKELSQNESMKTRCDNLGIKTIEDFKDKSQEYFEMFEKNQLRDIIFEFYQKYADRQDKNVNFERFILSEFVTKI